MRDGSHPLGPLPHVEARPADRFPMTLDVADGEAMPRAQQHEPQQAVGARPGDPAGGDRSAWALVAAISAAAFAIGCVGLASRSLWMDEAMTVGATLETVTGTAPVTLKWFAASAGVKVTPWEVVPALGWVVGVVKLKVPATEAVPPLRVAATRVWP